MITPENLPARSTRNVKDAGGREMGMELESTSLINCHFTTRGRNVTRRRSRKWGQGTTRFT